MIEAPSAFLCNRGHRWDCDFELEDTESCLLRRMKTRAGMILVAIAEEIDVKFEAIASRATRD